MKLIEILKYISGNPNSAFFYTPPIYDSSICYFFTECQRKIKIFSLDDVDEQLEKIDRFISDGLTAFGLIDYEFGYLLEERLRKHLNRSNRPLLHFLFCESESIKIIDSKKIDFDQLENLIGKQNINDFALNTKINEYKKNVTKIKNYIEEGDTYQVNYTVKSKFNLTNTVVELFLQLIFTQSAKYAAIINLEDKFIISSSPELFFEIDDDSILVKPMKGTIRRGINNYQDLQKKNELLISEKDRAENIMIVDLLRNDIGKICDYGSVEVINKYNLEKYESVFQLTSEVKGRLKTSNLSEILKNLFPSGSITGAPKLRTMEIINELEKENRGIYTGLIGIFSKKRSIANVAIRTIEIDVESKTGELGIGSGIVWDSEPENEYDEVILKSKFLTEPAKYFELFETMLFENGEIFLLDYHLDRLKNASEYFLFKYDEKAIRSELFLQIKSFKKEFPHKIKLSLSKWGKIDIAVSTIEENPSLIDIMISNKKVNSQNKFQYFKTTNREFYDEELRIAKEDGHFEVIFVNEKNNITEGAFTNLLIEDERNIITPSIEEGILNGCYRKYLFESDSTIQENPINREQLINSKRIILINSVRKEVKVDRVFDHNGKLLKDFT